MFFRGGYFNQSQFKLLLVVFLLVLFVMRMLVWFSASTSYNNGLPALNNGTVDIVWPLFKQSTIKGDRVIADVLGKNVLFFFNQDVPFVFGDRVRLTGTRKACESPRNPGAFNYCAWLFKKGIQSIFFVDKYSLLGPSSAPNLFRWVSQVPKFIMGQFKQLFPMHYGLIYTMVFGGRQDYLDGDVKSSFSQLGIVHLLVVSGAQISIISGVCFVLLRMVRLPVLFIGLGMVFCQVVYVLVAGWDASILRAVCMANLFLFNTYFRLKRYPLWWYLVGASLVIVWVSPGSVLLAGFWYSFFITCCLVVFTGPISKGISGPSWFIGYVVATVIAVLASVPIQVFQTSSFNVISLFSNVWISWSGSVILLGGCLAFFLAWVPFVGPVLGAIVDAIAGVMLGILQVFQGVHMVLRFSVYHIVLMSVCLGTFSMVLGCWFVAKDWAIQRWRYVVSFLCCWLVCWGVWCWVGISTRQMVVGIDVGQGDATLIIDGFKSILIDTGGVVRGKVVAENTVMPVLRYYGINHLDMVVITHADLDHVGGLNLLLEHYRVGQVVSPTPLPPAACYHAICDGSSVFKDGATSITFNLPHGELQLLSPSAVFPVESVNDASLLTFLRLGAISMFLTGDISDTLEYQLVGAGYVPNADVFKLGHHGSRYASTGVLLDAVSPEFVWNSAGKNNLYGHPHPHTLSRLVQRGIPWMSTHQDGAIIFNIKKGAVRSFLTNKRFGL
jgi:competence protein ComEC